MLKNVALIYGKLWKISKTITISCSIRIQKKIPKEKRQFHRQKDCSTSTSFSRIVSYIAKHDKAKQIIKEDYRKLPKSTKRERKHYNHAKQKMQKRESRDKMYRLDQIYKELEHA